MTSHRFSLPLIASLLLALPIASSAATWRVPEDFGDIQAGLDAAAPGDTILLAAGTYTRELQSSPLDFVQTRYIMRTSVVLAGATGDPNQVVLDGQDRGRVLTCEEGMTGVVVRDLTLTGGNMTFYGPTDGAGGGFACWNCEVTLENCVLRQNETGEYNEGGGAGAYLRGGEALIRDCLFLENIAVDSGGLRLSGVNGRVEDCVFRHNSAASAAGLAVATGPSDAPSNVTLVRCEFETNTASVFGAGVTVWSWCTAHFHQCLFLGNTADQQSGGALRCGDADVTLQNCRFEGNSAGTEGGAVYCAYWHGPTSTLDLLSCTLVDNTAGVSGGAIHLLSGAVLKGMNTDFAGNNAPAGADGSVVTGGDAMLTCCLTDPGLWEGTIILDDSGCTVSTESVSWGAVKALFR
jgi:predicted outer membrane repeat protein